MSTTENKKWYNNWGIPIALFVLFVIGRHWYLTSDVIVGDSAPDFSYVDLSGEEHLLSDYSGQNVIVHFWGSWCGPCREENKELVKIIGTEGVKAKIVSIGIEKDRTLWETAIRVDSLFWLDQYTDATYFDSAPAQAFDVKSIPAVFLVNKLGRVTAVNPSIEQIQIFSVAD